MAPSPPSTPNHSSKKRRSRCNSAMNTPIQTPSASPQLGYHSPNLGSNSPQIGSSPWWKIHKFEDVHGHIVWGDERLGEVYLPVATTFKSRQEAYQAGVHRTAQAGICGTEKTGAFSVCVNDGEEAYEEDGKLDYGRWIIVTGSGKEHQEIWEGTLKQPNRKGPHGYKALKASEEDPKKRLVRLLRGSSLNSPFAPEESGTIRYDGLYRVKDSHVYTSGSHKGTYKFLLIRLPGQRDVPARRDRIKLAEARESVDEKGMLRIWEEVKRS